jgi:uncharacterized protein
MPPAPIPKRRCPICGEPVTTEHRPFCSARCKLIDLGRWLDGNYRFATDDAPEEGADPREAPRD